MGGQRHLDRLIYITSTSNLYISQRYILPINENKPGMSKFLIPLTGGTSQAYYTPCLLRISACMYEIQPQTIYSHVYGDFCSILTLYCCSRMTNRKSSDLLFYPSSRGQPWTWQIRKFKYESHLYVFVVKVTFTLLVSKLLQALAYFYPEFYQGVILPG